MKSSKTARKPKPSGTVAVAAAPQPHSVSWPYAAGVLIAMFAVFQVYWPGIHGPFLLDDSAMPYMAHEYGLLPFRSWVTGLRPLLMFSFWLNYQSAGSQDNEADFAIWLE